MTLSATNTGGASRITRTALHVTLLDRIIQAQPTCRQFGHGFCAIGFFVKLHDTTGVTLDLVRRENDTIGPRQG
jgi:hypothetical protein